MFRFTLFPLTAKLHLLKRQRACDNCRWLHTRFSSFFQVAWMHFEQSAILTVHNHVITRNPRISVTHDKHDKHKTWFLHIANVQEEDKGRYMCQINTVTAKTQFGYLHVVGKHINNFSRLEHKKLLRRNF